MTECGLSWRAVLAIGPDAFRTPIPRGAGEDAMVAFAVANGVTMRTLSPRADFSYGFHRLALAPVR